MDHSDQILLEPVMYDAKLHQGTDEILQEIHLNFISDKSNDIFRQRLKLSQNSTQNQLRKLHIFFFIFFD